jgi:hypothetical protein
MGKDVWDDFFRTLLKKELSSSEFNRVMSDFETVFRETMKHGSINLGAGHRLVKCPEGRRGTFKWKDYGDAICFVSEVEDPSGSGTCMACSGPYYSLKDASFWFNKQKAAGRNVGRDKPRGRCTYNLFNNSSASEQTVWKYVFEYLVENSPEYEQADSWDEM